MATNDQRALRSIIRRQVLKVLREDFQEEPSEEISVGEYGGKGPFELPEEHQAGIRVPKGGSSCASCKWLLEDGTTCTNEYWVAWNGGEDQIPAPADEYCSDWWQPKE